MSKTEIYYFSGTGNSLAVARDIAARTNGRMIPVISVIEQEVITSEAESIGIVFPIYDFKAPQIIVDFIRKLKDIGSKYIFAVGTYGVVPLKAMKKLNSDIKVCGGSLSGGFIVKMPHNGIGHINISTDEQKKMFDHWSKKLDVICEYINEQKKGCIETNNVFVHFILSGLLFKALSALVPLLLYALKHGWEALGLKPDEKCNSCGTCARVCPVNNIKMKEDKPYWSKHCVMCFACLHWCPKEAIQIGNIMLNTKRYHHPEVQLSEMLRENQLKQ